MGLHPGALPRPRGWERACSLPGKKLGRWRGTGPLPMCTPRPIRPARPGAVFFICCVLQIVLSIGLDARNLLKWKLLIFQNTCTHAPSTCHAHCDNHVTARVHARAYYVPCREARCSSSRQSLRSQKSREDDAAIHAKTSGGGTARHR